MAMLETGVQALANRLPKAISPKTHAIIDYATAGSFAVAGALFWRSSRRAAITSWAVAAAETTIALLTDYPGGVADVISFETHGKLDASLAGAIAMLPTVVGFSHQKKSAFFRIQSVSIAGVTGMTDFEAMDRPHRPRRAA